MAKLLIIVTKWVDADVDGRRFTPTGVSTSVVEFDDKKSLEAAIRELDAHNRGMEDGKVEYIRL